MNEIRSNGFVKVLNNNNNNNNDDGVRVRASDLSSLGAGGGVPAVVRRSYEEFDRCVAIRRAVMHAVTSKQRIVPNVSTNNVAGKMFGLKPTSLQTKVTNSVAVVVAATRPAVGAGGGGAAPTMTTITKKNVVDEKSKAHAACLRAIVRGEFKLKKSGDKMKVKQQVVVGVKEAATRLCLRSIRLGEYKLKPVQTRVRNNVVVGGLLFYLLFYIYFVLFIEYFLLYFQLRKLQIDCVCVAFDWVNTN